MVIGSVLLQPHKVSAPSAPSPADLLEDVLALTVRLLWDRAHGGSCFSLIEKALGNSLQHLLAGMETGKAAAQTKFKAWAQPFLDRMGALGKAMPGESVAHEAIAAGDAIIGLLVELLDGITTDALAKHLGVVLKILHDDLGLTHTFLDQQVAAIFDEIVKQLRAAPPEANLAARENRFEIIALVKRIRRDIDGQFKFPEINVDRLAAPMLDRLRQLKYDDLVRRASVAGKSVKSGLDALEVISEEVTFSAGFSGGPGAAAAGSGGDKRCWYASWVTATETRDPNPAQCAALQPYSFQHQPADKMESITLHMTWLFTLADGILVSLAGYSKGRGVYSITTVAMIRDAIYAALAPLADINVPTMLNGAMGDLTAWFDKIFNIVAAALCSLEGRSLNSYDCLLYVFRFLFRFGAASFPLPILRDAILSFITLLNHDPSITPTPENRHSFALTQLFMQIVGPLIHAGLMPDNYFSINGEYVTLFAALLLGGLGMSVLTFFTGMFLSAAIAHDFPEPGKAALSWLKGWMLSIPTLVGLWFTFADGSTDSGKRGYTRDGKRGTQVAFAGYPDSATSPYLMPFAGAAECIQGNHGFWSHNSVTGEVFAYDFSLNLGQDVLCMRDGVVVGTPIDDVDDDASGDASGDGNHIVIKHNKPNADHDNDVAGPGAPTTTYAKYCGGQKDSIKGAFGGSVPAEGTAVTQGQLLFKCNSTGSSKFNHIHVQVNPKKADGSDGPAGYTIPWVFKDVPGKGVAESTKVYDSKNEKKP